MTDGHDSKTTRRGFLAGVGAMGTVGLAGCSILGGGSAEAPMLGDSDAAVTVEVFEDYACPHCATYSLTHFPRLRQEYVSPGTVRYEQYNFPIPVDRTESWRAANAVRYVYDEVGNEAFWDYSHGLFENQSRLGPALYAELAKGIDVDPASVRTAAVDRTYDETVKSSRQYGLDQGVQGTPAIIVDGQNVGRYDYETVSTAIDNALASESG